VYVSVSAARWDRRRLCMRPCAAVLELLWWTFWCTLSRCYTPHNERHDLIVAVASVQINKWHGRSHAYVVAEHWSALAEASGCARGWEYAETHATKVVIQQSVEKCVRWRAYENAARRSIASISGMAAVPSARRARRGGSAARQWHAVRRQLLMECSMPDQAL